MNINLILLAVVAFLAGLTEFVIAGILPFLADYFDVSIKQAGYLVTVFAFIFAVAGPILMMTTSKYSRRTLLLFFMALFIAGNLLSVFSQSYSMMMLSRIILAFSVSMVIGLAFALSVKVVPQHMQARSIGFVLMAISGAMVLGSPIGIFLSSVMGWKSIFIIITALSLIAFLLLYRYFPRDLHMEALSFKADFKGFIRPELLIAHLYSFLFFTGQSTFYIYFTPYLMHEKIDTGIISLLYMVFGVCGTMGSGLGGMITERIGSRKTLVLLSILYMLTMAGFLVSTDLVWLFINTALLGLIGWSINAPTQTYLIQAGPKYASINQTVSTSAVQFGISFGALLGGIILGTKTFTTLIIAATAILIIAAVITLMLYRLSAFNKEIS